MITASAPGRVNLIGEHTDYNDGFVLPTPIPQRASVELEPRDDDRVIATTRELGQTAEYRLGAEAQRGDWLDYIQGCTAALREAGYRLRGAELFVHSDVPLGAGLSSSAALEVAVLRAFREACALPIDDVALALAGQRAEHELVGAPVGAMDQLTASLGRPGFALFLDLRTLVAVDVKLPSADLVVIASGIVHDHAAGEYRTRRAECEAAARALGVKALRDVSRGDPRIARLPAPLDRRVRHVVGENARVLTAVDALAHGALVELGMLLRESHASLRDDYEVSVAAIDELVDIANADAGIYGARMTGGGFGGSIVALAKRGAGGEAAARIVDAFGARHRGARVLVAGEVR